jgi:hypothetical protein
LHLLLVWVKTTAKAATETTEPALLWAVGTLHLRHTKAALLTTEATKAALLLTAKHAAKTALLLTAKTLLGLAILPTKRLRHFIVLRLLRERACWVSKCWAHDGSFYLNPAVFFAIVLGCATNCFPAFFPARLALVVAAYSAGLRDLIAASGRYRSPVLLDGLPLLVLHFWSPQSFNDF